MLQKDQNRNTIERKDDLPRCRGPTEPIALGGFISYHFISGRVMMIMRWAANTSQLQKKIPN